MIIFEKKCSICGKEYKEKVNYCSYCGTKLFHIYEQPEENLKSILKKEYVGFFYNEKTISRYLRTESIMQNLDDLYPYECEELPNSSFTLYQDDGLILEDSYRNGCSIICEKGKSFPEVWTVPDSIGCCKFFKRINRLILGESGNSIKTLIIPKGFYDVEFGDSKMESLSEIIAESDPYYDHNGVSIDLFSKDGILYKNKCHRHPFTGEIERVEKYLVFYPPNKTEEEIEGALSGVNIIGKYAFAYNKIKNLIIPDNIGIIEEGAFLNCKNLTRVEIPNSVKNIGIGAFFGCSKLKQIIIPDGITRIAEYQFFGCSDLSLISLPESLRVINDYAFAFCKSLSVLYIPNKVNSHLYDNTFLGCVGLNKVVLPDYVNCSSSLFDSCDNLKIVITNRIDFPKTNKNGNIILYISNGTGSIKPLNETYLVFVNDEWCRLFFDNKKMLAVPSGVKPVYEIKEEDIQYYVSSFDVLNENGLSLFLNYLNNKDHSFIWL